MAKKSQNSIINLLLKKLKKIISKNKGKSITVGINIVMFLFFLLTIGLLRAIVFLTILDLIAYGFYYLMKKGNNKVKRKKIIRKFIMICVGFGIAVTVGIIAFIGLIVLLAPDFDPNNLYRKQSTIIYDNNGTIISKLGLEKREEIAYEEMPEVLIDAIIATEDSRFFQHNGFDLPRFLTATFWQLLGQDRGGASTITMQVSKNNYTSNTASGFEGIKRKFTDIYMSIFKIERNYTKEEILEFYVNQPYLGSRAYGVEQASLTYFGKSAKDLNLAEASLIAGLFQAPSRDDPFLHPDNATARRSTVLYLMERHGYITSEERAAANAITVESLLNTTGTATSKYRAFIDTVVEDVLNKTGQNPYVVPMEIYTTMDTTRQEHLDKIMSGESFKWENDVVDAGISVVDVKTGAIVAIGAGRNRNGLRQFNNATMIKRQIGSTAKPLYDYGPGIEYLNWSTYTPFADEPYTYSDKTPINNWDGKFQDVITMREALSRSRNIPALKAFKLNSNSTIKNFVLSMGLSPEIESGKIHEAHAIGGYNGESPTKMAAAYAAFANGGFYVKPYSFTKIIYRETGETFDNKIEKERVMSAATAYMITSILVDSGKIQATIPGVTFASKTGTTNFDEETVKKFGLPTTAINDLWFDAYTPDYAVSIWYGYAKIDKNYTTPITSRQHASIFKALAPVIFIKNSTFTKPSDVIEVQIERETYPAMLPSTNTPQSMIVTELFKRGTEPTDISPRYNYLNNVKNLDATISGKNVTLNWSPIATPITINPDAISIYFKNLYSDEEARTAAYNARLNYNSTKIGELGYNVYLKNEDGTLSLVGFTKDNTYTTNALNKSEATYVVKSTYTIFTASESSGAEITVSNGNNGSIIYAEMNGNTTINLSIGGTYNEQSVTVYEDLVDVSSSANITRTIKDGLGQSYANINTNVANTYTITYSIVYKSYTDILIRTVIVA